MNTLASLLLLGFGTQPINTLLEEEIIILTAEDLERKRAPVFFAVHRLGNTGVSIDFGLTTSSATAAGIGTYQLCVFSQPVTLSELPGKLAQADLIERTEASREERATFELRNEEITHSVLMIYQVTRSPPNARSVRGFCLPLTELMKTARLANRRPLVETARPFAA